EVGGEEKHKFLREAWALLFPINWAEPFGLVMIEAMACGTPVIAWRKGSVPEIIEDGVNGYVVGSIEEAVDAVDRIGSIDRQVCRDIFERRFDSRRMALDYVDIYERQLTEASGNSGVFGRIQ
ncbi:MAG: glycosyltransferase, partial [Bryobacteraceae bacterium]|nr:glycosyltransferase [Bryobacteraceae bacterium]